MPRGRHEENDVSPVLWSQEWAMEEAAIAEDRGAYEEFFDSKENEETVSFGPACTQFPSRARGFHPFVQPPFLPITSRAGGPRGPHSTPRERHGGHSGGNEIPAAGVFLPPNVHTRGAESPSNDHEAPVQG